MLKILYIYRALAIWGGIERVLVDKMNYLASNEGYDVYMVTANQGNHIVPYPLDHRVHLTDLGVQTHHMYRYRGLKRLLTAWRKYCLYRKLFTETFHRINPDIVICTTADDVGLLVRLKGNTPLIVECHNSRLGLYTSRSVANTVRRWYLYRQLRRAQAIVALTEGDAADWRRTFSQVRIIPNIVQLNTTGRYSDHTSRRVIFVGRFNAQKRVMEAVRIWQMVVSRYPDWHLDIYGEGSEGELLSALPLADYNIEVHKPTIAITDRYIDSAFLIMTSSFEPFGLVLPEAMSCGLPIVAYDVPYGPRSIITDGTDGFIVSDGDAQAFAERMCTLMSDPGLCSQMGRAAISSAQRFAASAIMPQWVQFFDELTGQGGRESVAHTPQ